MSGKLEALRREVEAYRRLRETWRDDPVKYARERLGLKPTWQQQGILEAIAPEGAKVSCRAGHGIGKSGATAGAIWWFLETRNYSKIPCTAPTSHQLKDVLWAELAKWARAADALSRARGDHPRLWLSSLFRTTNDRIYDLSASDEWFAVARTSGRDNPDALQGFHASNVEVAEDGMTLVDTGKDTLGQILFVIDEASGVFEGVFEVAEGALSSHGARLLMLGNATKTTGYFARSHHQDRREFTTLHFRSGDSPLVDPDYRARLVRKYGEGSNVVRVRADGDFPKQDDDALISLEHTEPAINREAYADERRATIRLGVDVARFGDDRTVFLARQGRNVILVRVAAKQDTMATANQASQIALEIGATDIDVDVVGIGAGVADRLREIKRDPQSRLKAQINDVNVACSAPLRRKNNKDTVEAQGAKLRDYLWLAVADWLRDEAPSFGAVDSDLAEDLAGELVSTKFKLDANGCIVVERKEDMKKRLGHSPDIADSLCLTFSPGSRAPLIIPDGLTRESPWTV